MRCALVSDVLPPWMRSLHRESGVPVVRSEALARLPGTVQVLVRWGTVRGSDRGFPRVVNRREALRLALDAAGARRRLDLNGLPVRARRELATRDAVRLFRVEVFDLRPLAVRRLVREQGHWRFRSARQVPRRAVRRATSAAVRALHALGLDAGRADVALLPGSGHGAREAVCAVNPAPDWPAPLATRLGRVLADLDDGARNAGTTWTFGADPEFVFVDPATGRVASASRFLSRRGRAGCDAQTDRGDRRIHPIAEVRPTPRQQVGLLAREIHHCLAYACDRLSGRNLRWLAGTLPGGLHALGGHVHFSGGPLSGPLLRALDTYVAVPVMLVERSEAARTRRRRHGYLGDVRFKAHGGFEYRTLPSWLVSPRMARAVLALTAWVVADHARLPADLFLDTAALEAFYAGDKAPFYDVAQRLAADLHASPSAERHARAVRPLFDLIDRRDPWPDDADLRRTWRLRPGAAGDAATRQAR